MTSLVMAAEICLRLLYANEFKIRCAFVAKTMQSLNSTSDIELCRQYVEADVGVGKRFIPARMIVPVRGPANG